MKRFRQHPWTVAAGNLLLVMALYTLSRVFFYLVNPTMYPGVTGAHLWEMCMGGLRFDLTAVLYLSSLYLLLALLPLHARGSRIYGHFLRWTYFLPNALGLIANTADMAYIPFTDRRTTCTFFSEFSHDGNIGTILRAGVVDYWYITLFGIAVLAALWLLYRPIRYDNDTPEGLRYACGYDGRKRQIFYYVHETVLLIVSVYLVVIGIRGGFGRYTRPITISNAMQYVDRPSETAIVLNTPFSLMKSIENEQYVDPQYYPKDRLESIFSPIHGGIAAYDTLRYDNDTCQGHYDNYTPAATIRPEGYDNDTCQGHYDNYTPEATIRPAGYDNENGAVDSTPKNVVVLILESFATEHIGFYNRDLDGGRYQGYTPFLDSLLCHSYTYARSYASGRKSIDAMPSILSSIPMLIEPYIVTPYATNAVSSLGDVLRKEGYETAFFHGAPNGSMGFQAYARSAGIERYYGMNEYDGPEAFDGTWAIWDEEFLDYYCRTMDTLREPFFTAVFTASSHHPFRVPERYEGVFPEGPRPLCRCIAYSDNALRRFFNEARKQPWYEHTLFVLTADHTNELYHPEYTTDEGLYRVPIAFFDPSADIAKVDSERIASQTDIMPSVLGYLGYKGHYFAFGEDALTQDKTHNWAVCYNNPYYEIIGRDGLLLFDGKQVVKREGQVSAAEEQAMIAYLKAYIQQYIERMKGDRLRVER